VPSVKPPIPTQSEENWLPARDVFTVGTTHVSVTARNVPAGADAGTRIFDRRPFTTP
jgi:hypothetical protein